MDAETAFLLSVDGDGLHDLFDLLRRPAWQDQAACRGMNPDVFHPGRGQPVDEVRRICRGCPVRVDCLDYALANRCVFGVWGGLSERERRQLRKARKQVAA